jgi:hypothetical protein
MKSLKDVMKAINERSDDNTGIGKIVKVHEGKVSDFIPRDKMVGDKSRADKPAIRLEISTPDGYNIQSPIMPLSSHPRSWLYKFIKSYGEPKAGNTVSLEFNEATGFWELSFPVPT